MIKKMRTHGARMCTVLLLLSGTVLAAPSYNDVLVVVNDGDTSTVVVNGLTKPVSVAVGEYFQAQRHMPAQNLCHVNVSPAQVASNTTYLALVSGVSACLAQTGVDGHPLNESVNYIVLTKGLPISYNDPSPALGNTSVGNALFADLTGLTAIGTHPYYNKREHFSKTKFNMYLVTYLIGYDYAQSIALVDRASQAFGNTGKLVLDRGVYWTSYTKPWFVDARTAMEARGFTGVYDWDPANDNLPSDYITDVSGIMMYHSSGSNDGYCPAPNIQHLGFVPGAIGDTYVSSSGRTFLYDTTGGLAKFTGGAFTRYAKATEQDLPYHFTGHIAFDGATIWVGTAPQSSGATKLDGIYLFDAATATPTGTHFTTANSGLASNKVTDIVVDGNWIWVATAGGLSRYNKSTATWESTVAFALGTANIYDIEIDAANNELWVAYPGSVRRYNRSTGALLNAYTTANGLLSTYAPSLSLDAGGVWIATSAGLQYWDRASASLYNYTTANGLRDNYVRVVRAGQTKIWVGYQNSVNGANLGVSALDRTSGAWTHYYYDPASPATSPLDNSVPLSILIEPGDSRVWVATGGRLNAFTSATGQWTNYPIYATQDLAYDGTSVWASAVRAGQSLIADLIHDGISGVQGYVSEPYVDAISLPGILYPRYADGYNLAESFYMASNEIRWKNIVVGDPKAAPFAPRLKSLIPASGAGAVEVDARAGACFASPGMGPFADMDWSSLSSATITAQAAGGATETLALTYDRDGQCVTINPATFWKGSTTYTITLKGGPSGIRNAAGASLFAPDTGVNANDVTWTFSTVADADNDGLSDAREAILGTNPNVADTDGDGVSDGVEVYFGTDPLNAASKPDLAADPDGDGLSNAQELAYRTNPNLADSDGDGVPDNVEIYLKYSPTNAASKPDLNADPDGDGLNNQGEFDHGTDPYNADTDGDGLTDGDEVNVYGTDPLRNADLDGDGLTDSEEIKIYLTAYNNPDTDGDGLTDGAEVKTYGTNPKLADTDGDRLTDGEEVNIYHTNPLSAVDSDGDGMADDWERVRGTNPAVDDARGDLDNDGVDNIIEYLRRTLPNDASSKPAIKTVYVDASNTSGVEDGTATYPYSTVEKGIGGALAGDTVSVASGNYTITSFWSVGKSIRLIGPANRGAVINASWLYMYGIKWGEWSGLDLRVPYFYVGSSRNLIFRNDRFELGEDIYPYGGTRLQIENSLLVAIPTATEAIYVENSEVTLINDTVVGFPAGIRLTTPDARLTLRNSILVNTDDLDGVSDGSTIAYNLISNGDFAGANGNLAGSPLFVDAAAGNYHLAVGSPGIDAGDPAAAFGNEPLPHGCRINMGAYGNTVEAEASSDPDGNGAYGVCPSCRGTSVSYRYTLNGKVTTGGKRPAGIAGVAMNLAGPNNCGAKATTATDGSYSLGKLVSGSYTLAPSKNGCSSFNPSSATLSVTKNKTQNFTGACP